MPLSMAEMSAVTRHLRYPVLGMMTTSTSGGSLATGTAVSYRYTQTYGQLLWRLNNLSSNEECRIVGKAYGAITFIGPVPNVGDASVITISGGGLASPVNLTLTVTQQMIDQATPQGRQAAIASQYFNANIGLGLAAQVSYLVATSAPLVAAGFVSNAPYGVGPYSQQVIPVPEVNITNPQAFTISVVNNGLMALQVVSNGVLLSPSISPNQLSTPLYGYLPILDFMETQYANSTNILQIDTADVFKARKTVLAESLSLYQTWCQRLAEFLDVPLNVNRKGDFGKTSPRAYL